MPEESYTVFARRYRPATFDEVVGQEHVATTLRNAITENRVGHAYLFSGPRGVGKTSMARIFAKALNCAKGPTLEPCGTCSNCALIHEGSDADVIEMDAASNRSVEDARSLREGVRYAPLRSRSKIYIVDEAHMLTREAFNTLLKTLEEPPPHVKFILATTEIHKFPDTITSRCQRFEFRRITAKDIANRLRQIADGEKIGIDPAVLDAVARAGRGSMRDAQSILDQLVAYKESDLTRDDVMSLLGAAADREVLSCVDGIAAADPKAVLESLDRVFGAGVDGTSYIDQLLDHFRSLLLLRSCGRESSIVDLPDTDLEAAAKQSEKFSLDALLYAIQLTLEARRRVREGADARLVLEVTGVKLSRIGDLVSLSEAIRTLDRAPERTEPRAAPAPSPAPVPGPPPPAPPAEPEAAPPPVSAPAAEDRVWAAVVEAAKKKNLLVGTLLGEGRVLERSPEVLEFFLPSKFKKFHLDALKEDKNLAVIEEAIEKAYGRRRKFQASIDRASASAGPAPAAPPRTENVNADASVRKVLDTFPGSKIVGIE